MYSAASKYGAPYGQDCLAVGWVRWPLVGLGRRCLGQLAPTKPQLTPNQCMTSVVHTLKPHHTLKKCAESISGLSLV